MPQGRKEPGSLETFKRVQFLFLTIRLCKDACQSSRIHFLPDSLPWYHLCYHWKSQNVTPQIRMAHFCVAQWHFANSHLDGECSGTRWMFGGATGITPTIRNEKDFPLRVKHQSRDWPDRDTQKEECRAGSSQCCPRRGLSPSSCSGSCSHSGSTGKPTATFRGLPLGPHGNLMWSVTYSRPESMLSKNLSELYLAFHGSLLRENMLNSSEDSRPWEVIVHQYMSILASGSRLMSYWASPLRRGSFLGTLT